MLALAATVRCEDSAGWWDSAWGFRQVVDTVEPKAAAGINTAVAALPPDAKCATDGRDVRVLNDKGQFVPYRVIAEAGKPVHVKFQVAGESGGRFTIYYGNPKATAEQHSWSEKLGGLYLETRANPMQGARNARNLSHFTQILGKSSKALGRKLWPQINDLNNPFGDDDMYLSIYRGELFCPESGKYGFATNSDDSSFLLIDGQLVCEWPDGHIPSQTWEHRGVKVLSRGVHKIEYYHLESYGGQLSRAGWKRPSDETYSLIPAWAFVRELPCAVVAAQKFGRPANAFFTFEERPTLRVNVEHTVPHVVFRDCSSSFLGKVDFHRWDLGDGTTSSVPSPRHHYLEPGTYEVSLTVTDDLGYEDKYRRKITVRQAEMQDITILLETQVAENVLYPNESLEVNLRLQSNSPKELPLTLHTMLVTGKGHEVSSEDQAIQLQPNEWQTVTKSFSPRRDRSVVRFVLSCYGKSVVRETVSVLPTSAPLTDLRIRNENLVDAQGRLVALRIVDERSPRPSVRRFGRIRSKTTGKRRIVVVDDSLSRIVSKSNENSTYYGMLRSMLQQSAPNAQLDMVRLGLHTNLAGYPPLVRLSKVHEDTVATKPDLVILACSIYDIHQCLPLDRFERYLRATLDQILAQTKADVIVIDPPPLIVNPKISKRYAFAAKRIGVERNVTVADVYSIFLSDMAKPDGLQALYRDEMEPDPVFSSCPNRKGQALIARELYRMIMGGT